MIYICLLFKLPVFFSLSLISLHLLYTHHLQNWDRMEFLTTPFLHTAQGNLLSIVVFSESLLLIIIFVFLRYTLNPFHPNPPF